VNKERGSKKTSLQRPVYVVKWCIHFFNCFHLCCKTRRNYE